MNLKLRPYQQKIVTQLVETDPFKGVLRIDTRLGKSVISITAACSLKLGKVVVVCPAFLIPSWKNEVKKWSFNCTKFDFYSSDNFFKKHPGMDEYDLLVWDELHRPRKWRRIYYTKDKNGKTVKKRGGQNLEMLVLHVLSAKRFLGLSATPMISGAEDLYPVLSGLNALNKISITQFRKIFCLASYNRHSRGLEYHGTNPASEKVLREICDKYFIHLRKKDVWKQLPKKTVDKLYIDIPKIPLDESILVRFVESLREGREFAPPEIKSARLELGLKKVGKVVRFCEGINGQYVVFTWHRAVAEAIQEELSKLYDTGLLLGGSRNRDSEIQRFREGKYRAIVCTIGSSGVGLDFSNASCSVFAELPYTPADLEQCEARIENINRTSPVNIYHILANHKLDKRVSELLEEKRIATRIME